MTTGDLRDYDRAIAPRRLRAAGDRGRVLRREHGRGCDRQHQGPERDLRRARAARRTASGRRRAGGRRRAASSPRSSRRGLSASSASSSAIRRSYSRVASACAATKSAMSRARAASSARSAPPGGALRSERTAGGPSCLGVSTVNCFAGAAVRAAGFRVSFRRARLLRRRGRHLRSGYVWPASSCTGRLLCRMTSARQQLAADPGVERRPRHHHDDGVVADAPPELCEPLFRRLCDRDHDAIAFDPDRQRLEVLRVLAREARERARVEPDRGAVDVASGPTARRVAARRRPPSPSRGGRRPRRGARRSRLPRSALRRADPGRSGPPRRAARRGASAAAPWRPAGRRRSGLSGKSRSWLQSFEDVVGSHVLGLERLATMSP